MPEEKIEHSVEESRKFCCFNTYKYTVTLENQEKVRTKKRLACRTYPISYVTFMNFVLIGGIIIGIDFVLKRKMMEFSLSDSSWGIKNVQSTTPIWLKAFLRA